MRSLAQEKCFNHAEREAAVFCLSCKSFYCRECVAEHDGRLLCARCVKQATQARPARQRGFAAARRALALVAGLFIAWVVFYACGQALLLIPTSFHEGTFWQDVLGEGDNP